MNRFEGLALFTDLYELTMLAAYHRRQMTAPATFSLFIRGYPPDRGYFVNAGLEEVLDFLEDLRFLPEDLEYLRHTALFTEDFLTSLEEMRFTGDVFALPEGTVFFADEPILEITAPLPQAQLLETFVINAVNLQVSLATKAARCVHAAGDRQLVDFSLRRTQGTDAGNKAARAAYLAGFSGTSNVLAGKLYGIPLSGTMAHSFVTTFTDELESFRAFAETFPNHTILLIDTYDTLSGARKAARLAKEMATQGKKLRGVRLDSGDMVSLSREVRAILDREGLPEVKIYASGAFDEHRVAEAIGRGAQIDAFGVGTKFGVSADAPYTDMIYKLVRYEGRAILKLSSGKITLAGEKQVYRVIRGNRLSGHVIARRDERLHGEPLLQPVMRAGKRCRPKEPLDVIRSRCRTDLAMLEEKYKSNRSPAVFPVSLSPGLQQLQDETRKSLLEAILPE